MGLAAVRLYRVGWQDIHLMDHSGCGNDPQFLLHVFEIFIITDLHSLRLFTLPHHTVVSDITVYLGSMDSTLRHRMEQSCHEVILCFVTSLF